MKLLSVIVLIGSVLLSGCATVQQGYAVGVEAADQLFAAARVAYCNAQTIGAVRRFYGRNTEGLSEYLRACGWDEESVEKFTEVKEYGSN